MRRSAMFLVPLAALGVTVLGGASNSGSSRMVASTPALSAPDRARGAGIDVGGVVETVSHRVVPGKRGTLFARDRLYRAEFSSKGISMNLANSIFRLETFAVRQGATQLPAAPSGWEATQNRAQRRLLPGVTERLLAREGHLEWEYVLDRPLPGTGDLRIAARIGSSGAASRRGKSLEWPIGKGRAVKMGELVVRDAHRREIFRALPRVSGKRLTLRVPAEILARAAYPVVLDPVISPEYPASDPFYVAASEDQAKPAVASDGAGFLVVWEDYRYAHDIYAARVNSSGTVLDGAGILISPPYPEEGSEPAVAWDGTNYLVVWASDSPNDILGARVTPSGNVLDTEPITVSGAAGDQMQPTVAWNGSNYLVAWRDHRSSGYDVFGARVSGADRSSTQPDFRSRLPAQVRCPRSPPTARTGSSPGKTGALEGTSMELG